MIAKRAFLAFWVVSVIILTDRKKNKLIGTEKIIKISNFKITD